MDHGFAQVLSAGLAAAVPQGNIVGRAIVLNHDGVIDGDVFDALLSDRVYRPALSADETMDVLKDGSGAQFDPEIVDLLLIHLNRALEVRGA